MAGPLCRWSSKKSWKASEVFRSGSHRLVSPRGLIELTALIELIARPFERLNYMDTNTMMLNRLAAKCEIALIHALCVLWNTIEYHTLLMQMNKTSYSTITASA